MTNEWKKPTTSEERSPCPMLNSLANHDYIPRSGKNIPVEQLIQVLINVTKLDRKIAKTLATDAFKVVGKIEENEQVFNLKDLVKFDHDGSLTRQNSQGGKVDSVKLDIRLIDELLRNVDTDGYLTLNGIQKARQNRVAMSKKEPEFAISIKSWIISHGETIFLTGVLGNERYKVKKEIAEDFLKYERLAKGWGRQGPLTPFELARKLIATSLGYMFRKF